MALPRYQRAALAAAAIGVLALTACGSKSPQDPNASPTGQGQLGDAPSASASATADGTPAATTTTQGGGGTTNPYPSNAKDYGLEILKAIANNNDARIVDLSSLNTAQYVQQQNYKAKNGQWTHANCDSGATQYCHYYNQTGDFASVGVETSKLSSKGAVSSVTIEGNTFASDAVNYVGQFAYNWTYDAGFVRMRAYATQQVVDAVSGKQKLNAGGGGVMSGGAVSCPPANQGKTCVEMHAVGGSLTISYTFVVDPTKVGKPNAVIGVL